MVSFHSYHTIVPIAGSITGLINFVEGQMPSPTPSISIDENRFLQDRIQYAIRDLNNCNLTNTEKSTTNGTLNNGYHVLRRRLALFFNMTLYITMSSDIRFVHKMKEGIGY